MLAFLLIASGMVTAAPAASISAQEAERQLQDITPTFTAPYASFVEDWQPLALRLLGVDLAQNGKLLPGPRPALDSSLPLTVTCYWLAEAEITQKRGLEIKIVSHDGQIFKAEEVKAGPDALPWNVGSVYPQNFELSLAPVAAMISGDSVLVLSLFPRLQASTAPVPLQNVPLYLSPSVRPGRVSARSLDVLINGDYHDLSVSFRLGRGASLTIQLPEQTRGPATAIAVVSSVSYGSVQQDEPVCEIVAKSLGANSHTWELLSGVDTARSDFDFYPQGSVNHQKVRIVESWDAEYPDVFDKPFKKHKYFTILPLPKGSRNLVSLDFISKTPFVLDVFDVALVQTKQEE